MADEEKKDQTEEETGTVSLVSQEGDSFDVPMGVARMSELVKTMIDGEHPFPPDSSSSAPESL